MSKRLQVDMTDEAYQKLQHAASEQGKTVSELVRRSLNIESFLREQAKKDAGSKVVVRSGEGEEQEIVIVP